MRLAAALLVALAAPVAAAELVMVGEPGCPWCARWDAEIAPAYPLTPEGQAAPLRRVELGALPADIAFEAPVRFSPTFVLVEDGVEIARLEGYPGDDFFWPMLGQLLDRLPQPAE